MTYPDSCTAATAPDRAADTSGPFDGFEQETVEWMRSLINAAEECRSDLEAEGVDVSDLLTAAETLQKRAQEWLGDA